MSHGSNLMARGPGGPALLVTTLWLLLLILQYASRTTHHVKHLRHMLLPVWDWGRDCGTTINAKQFPMKDWKSIETLRTNARKHMEEQKLPERVKGTHRNFQQRSKRRRPPWQQVSRQRVCVVPITGKYNATY